MPYTKKNIYKNVRYTSYDEKNIPEKDRENAILLKQLDIQAKQSIENSSDNLEELKLTAKKLNDEYEIKAGELAETVRSNKAKEANEVKKIAAAAKKSVSSK